MAMEEARFWLNDTAANGVNRLIWEENRGKQWDWTEDGCRQESGNWMDGSGRAKLSFITLVSIGTSKLLTLCSISPSDNNGDCIDLFWSGASILYRVACRCNCRLCLLGLDSNFRRSSRLKGPTTLKTSMSRNMLIHPQDHNLWPTNRDNKPIINHTLELHQIPREGKLGIQLHAASKQWQHEFLGSW